MTKTYRLLALALAASFAFAGCADETPGNDGALETGSNGTGSVGTTTSRASGSRENVDQAGSSTVLPIAEAWAEEFGRSIGANIVVSGGGSGAGIAKFCRGELDIADASRPMRQSEIDTCKGIGIDPYEMTVAIDGLSVVVSKDNDFVDCLTTAQLHKMWTADASKQVNKWNQIDPSWPDAKIELFGPGTDSGTYDYWREVIIAPNDGSSATTRPDYTASEDDNVLVNGVASKVHAMAFFGLAYYEENADKLNLVKVDEGKGKGCVEPTAANVESGEYSPLSRPLFMYTKGKPTGVLQKYFEKAYSEDGQALVEEVGYIKLPATKLAEMKAKNA